MSEFRAFAARLAKFLATYGPAFLVLLSPALFNRFPLVYSDTGTYLASAIKPFLPEDRPIHYSVFLYALHLRQTLWPIVIAQAGITIAVMAIFFEVSLGRLRRLHMAVLLAVLAAITALPVSVSEVMPDLYAPLLICSLIILALGSISLTKVQKVFLYAVVLLAICVHQANLFIAATLLITLMVAQSRLKPALAGPWLAVAAGFALLVAPNAANEVLRHRRFSLSPVRGSSVFMLAKLFDDGIGFDYLDEECTHQSFSICAQLPALHQYRRKSPNADNLDFFLWGGPLLAAGGIEGVRPYAGSVVLHSLLRYPLRFLLASLRDSGRQSILLSTGEGITRYEDGFAVSLAVKNNFPPALYDEFQRSRQQSGSLTFARLSKFYVYVVLGSVVTLGALAKRVYAADIKFRATILMLLAGFFANALVMGTLGRPLDRYQNRVSCLIPLAAMTALAYRYKVPSPLANRTEASSGGVALP